MLNIDYTAPKPLHEQIEEQISSLIATGILQPNDWLPSVRQLATEMSINPNTVQRAYSSLENKGVIVSVKGRGSFVSPDLAAIESLHDKVIGDMIRDLVAKAKLAGWSTEKLGVKIRQILEEEEKTE